MSQDNYEKEKTNVTIEYYNQLLNLKPEKGLKNVNLFRKKALWALKNLEPKQRNGTITC